MKSHNKPNEPDSFIEQVREQNMLLKAILSKQADNEDAKNECDECETSEETGKPEKTENNN